MRIVFISPEFVTEPYYSGGLANYAHRMTLLLAEAGHDVHVLVRAPKSEAAFNHRGVSVHRLSSDAAPDLPPGLFNPDAAPDTFQWLRFSLAASEHVRRLHAEKTVGLVQAANSRACGLFTILRTAIPVITRISCYRPQWNIACSVDRTPDVRATEWAELMQLKSSRHLFAPSRALSRMLTEEADIPHVEVIPSPAYVETLTEDDALYRERLDGKRYLLYVGRLQRHKGVDVLGDALPPVLERDPGLHVVFAGADAPDFDGVSMRAKLSRQLEAFGDRLAFLGQTPHERLYPVIRKALAVVLPSRIDNLPNTCLEAMTLGRPVVGTRGTSFDELIENRVTGFLCQPGDAAGLTQAMTDALDCDQDAMGGRARAALARLAPERILERHLAYYGQALGADARGRNA